MAPAHVFRDEPSQWQIATQCYRKQPQLKLADRDGCISLGEDTGLYGQCCPRRFPIVLRPPQARNGSYRAYLSLLVSCSQILIDIPERDILNSRSKSLCYQHLLGIQGRAKSRCSDIRDGIELQTLRLNKEMLTSI